MPANICTFISEAFLQELANDPKEEIRRTARNTLRLDRLLHTGEEPSTRSINPKDWDSSWKSHPKGVCYRLVYNGKNRHKIPGELAFEGYTGFKGDPRFLREHGHYVYNDPKSRCMSLLYARVNTVYKFFKEVFDYEILDGKGYPVTVTAHFEQDYENCAWDIDNRHLIVGDGDPNNTVDFTNSKDVLAHEITHGIISFTTKLQYHDQAGALNEHLADVCGVLCLERNRAISKNDMEWTIGSKAYRNSKQDGKLKEMTNPKIEKENFIWNACGMPHPGYARSLKDPGSGWEKQPRHMRDYKAKGDPHYNSGIPNFAFYTAAMEAPGMPWERIGKIWFYVMTNPKLLKPDCSFAHFADATRHAAKKLDPNLENPIIKGWEKVGVTSSK